MNGGAVFEGPRIFVHAPHYEWLPEVHVLEQGSEAHQHIMAIEEWLHCFGYWTEARELELYQWLDEAQIGNASFATEIHKLPQYIIVKLAGCISCLKLLAHNVQK